MKTFTLSSLLGFCIAILASSCMDSAFKGEQETFRPAPPPEKKVETPDNKEGAEDKKDESKDNLGDNSDQGQDGLSGNEDSTKTFGLRCTNDNKPTTSRLEAKKGTFVKIDGDLCPSSFGKLSVLFVIDFSGSMANSDPTGLLNLFRCGRLAAAKSIISKIEDDMSDSDDVSVGMVSFDTGAQIEEALMPLADFKSNVNTFEMCGSNTNGYTNYKAAFDAANSALNGVQGNKLIYFISDGLPTVGGTGQPDNTDAAGTHKTAGLDAIKALKQNHSDVSVNAIFLNAGGAGQAEAEYLAKITEDKNRVRLANNASQLAEKAVELSIPGIKLIESEAKVTLESAGSGPQIIDLATFERKASSNGDWHFVTKPFELIGENGKTVTNTVTIEAPDKEGRTHKNVIEIDYKQQ